MIDVPSWNLPLAIDLPENLGEIIVVVVLLFGGMVKSIYNAVKGEGAKGTKPKVPGARPGGGRATREGSGGPLPDTGDEAGGLDRWKALLRGDAPPPEVVHRPAAGEGSRARPRVEPRPAPSEPQRRIPAAEQPVAPIRPVGRVQSAAARPEAAVIEKVLESAHDTDVRMRAGGGSERADLPSEGSQVAEEERRAAGFERRLDEPLAPTSENVHGEIGGPVALRVDASQRLHLAHGWRRAIVTAELLGRPVALRGREGGPVGLRD